jgi:hypothetical protein
MNPLVVILLAAGSVVGVAGLSVLPPDSADPTTFSPVPDDTYADLWLLEPSESRVEPSTSLEPAPVGICPPVYALALSEGFTAAEAEILDRIAWHESRCFADAVGDLNRGVSLGILQVHSETWCRPSKYWPTGYLQAALILERCEELFDPVIAVRAARAIFLEGGFEQWTTYRKALES